MRILHIIGTLNPASGGPAASVPMLIEFGRAGDHGEAVTLDDPGAAFLAQLDFPVTALGPARTRFGYTPRLIPWLRSNAACFDAVVVHGLWQFCGLATWRAFGSNVPYFVFAHGMLDPYFKRAFPFKHMKKWCYWHAAEFWVLRGASRVLFTCAAEERLARKTFLLNRWQGHVVSYGARVPDTPPHDLRRHFVARFPHLQDRRFLLFLGRIDRKKGCDLLVQAFLELAAQDRSFDLVMAGPDKTRWRPRLERMVQYASLNHRVHWIGMLEGNQKWSAFAACEAFVLPSHQENFGIAVAEAMAFAKPVLLSDKVNIAPDIVADGAGIMEPDTLEGTRRLLRRWLALSEAERAEMGQRARNAFRQRYDMRTNALEFNNLLERATHRQSLEPLAAATLR
jgi:glycosyltransferase involved in cell wall biosynthesis